MIRFHIANKYFAAEIHLRHRKTATMIDLRARGVRRMADTLYLHERLFTTSKPAILAFGADL